MQQISVNLFEIPFEKISHQVKAKFPYYSYDFKKHLILLLNDKGDSLGQIRLPLHIAIDDELKIVKENPIILYLTIASGNAAISVMEGKNNLYHTTFSAYMTRKKQGVSQIKYLNKKGKSRAGSRVRLASTIEFFENINTTLNTLFKEHSFDRIALNCNATLIPYLYNAKVACPFDKKDPRLYKIPLHIQKSNYTNLDKAVKKLMAPVLFCEEGEKKIADVFQNF